MTTWVLKVRNVNPDKDDDAPPIWSYRVGYFEPVLRDWPTPILDYDFTEFARFDEVPPSEQAYSAKIRAMMLVNYLNGGNGDFPPGDA